MKILHLIIDHQVIERTLGIYEKVFPKSNDVIYFSQLSNDTQPKHLTIHKFSKTILLGKGNVEGHQFNFSDYTHIIAHYLTLDMISFIKEAPKTIHVTWEIYGFDLYNQFLEPMGYKIAYSDQYNYVKHGFIRKHMPQLYDILLYLTGHHVDFTYKKIRSFKYICKRVNAIQYCCKYDAEYVEEYANRPIKSYEIFNYSLSEVLGELLDSPFTKGHDIMVGNSASYSNNHLYILNYIKDIKIEEDSHIIIPLSYGGSIKYVNEVETVYRKHFGQAIETLKEYMPLHDYNRVFLRLKVIYLSAWRQESQGTAIMAFYMGIKVFMSIKSPLYKWFVDLNFIVFAIEKAKVSELNSGLSLEEKKHNRNIVLSRYSDQIFEQTLKSNFK